MAILVDEKTAAGSSKVLDSGANNQNSSGTMMGAADHGLKNPEAPKRIVGATDLNRIRSAEKTTKETLNGLGTL